MTLKETEEKLSAVELARRRAILMIQDLEKALGVNVAFQITRYLSDAELELQQCSRELKRQAKEEAAK